MTDREVMQQALEALSAELWTMLDKPVDEQYRVKYAYLLTLITALRTALAQPKHEPMAVAYLCENGVGHRYFRWKKPSDIYKPIGLYTAPPQREWVGLTDEEQQQLFDQWQDNGWGSFYNAIEAKLKELNK